MSLSINSTWRVELFSERTVFARAAGSRGIIPTGGSSAWQVRAVSSVSNWASGPGRQDRQVYRLGNDPSRIVRRKCDFVRRLPGHGRRSLVGLLANKVVRRLTPDPFI